MHASLFDEALWVRVAFYDPRGPYGLSSAADVVLLVYYPHTHYLITTSIKAAYREFVHQVRPTRPSR